MSKGALPGFRDFYPAELAERAHIMAVWRDVARRFGFAEYDGPPLEPLELYTKKSGDEIVAQLYAFKDKGDRDVALRPEMTPTFARMVSARVNALRKPVRWFSTPQLFRYERQQRGRLREHFQFNVDIVGESDVAADAELLAVAIEVMRGCGLTEKDVVARVSDRRLLNALLDRFKVPEAARPLTYAVLDKARRGSRSVLEKRLIDGGIDPIAAGGILELAKPANAVGFDSLDDARSSGLIEHTAALDRYQHHVEALGVSEWIEVDFSVVRGLDYYTGIVFELFDRQGKLRAICGGGRYDNLLASLGGVDLPALGFGMGDVVLAELMRERGTMPAFAPVLDFWVATDDSALQPEVMRVATRLRRAGKSAEYALRDQQLSRQLKAAVAAGASEVVILSREPLGRGEVVIRRLADGAERTVALTSLDKISR